MAKLNVGGSPVSSWAVTQSLEQLGLKRALQDGTVAVQADGRVTVKGAAGAAFDAQVRTPQDLQALLTAIGAVGGAAATHVPTRQALDIFGTVVTSDIENHVNARTWYGQTLRTDLRPEFTSGRQFSLPMLAVPPQDAQVLRANAGIPGLAELEAFFRRPDGSVLLPMHPQELEHRSLGVPVESVPARTASSERTLHVQLPGTATALVKVDLAHVMNSLVYRPLGATAGYGSVSLTEFLWRWSMEHEKANDAFAFLPEPLTVADTKNDLSAIVRIAEPFPPPASGQKTWIVPMYSLTAPDPDFADQPPMLIRLVDSRPDLSVPPLQYALDAVVGPAIESALRVYLDLGSSAQMHGQNSFLEIGEDGRPTGRVAHSDLEAFWPNPALAGPLGRPDFFQKYGIEFNADAKESHIFETFRDYFVSQNLGPMIDCLSTGLSLPRGDVEAAVVARLREGVQQRREVVQNNAVLSGFRDYL